MDVASLPEPFREIIPESAVELKQRLVRRLQVGRSLYFANRFAACFGARFFARNPSADWIVCAVTIARINPGKRCSNSVQREMLCISTPCRSLRIKPASRRILKCCESVDFGIALSLTVRKFEQLWGHSCATMSTYMATRTGSDSAWRIPSTVTPSIDGWKSGRIPIRVAGARNWFNSSQVLNY